MGKFRLNIPTFTCRSVVGTFDVQERTLDNNVLRSHWFPLSVWQCEKLLDFQTEMMVSIFAMPSRHIPCWTGLETVIKTDCKGTICIWIWLKRHSMNLNMIEKAHYESCMQCTMWTVYQRMFVILKEVGLCWILQELCSPDWTIMYSTVLFHCLALYST